ncbi:MAG: tRNA (cytidine(34)-2'-O)-methyltransferase [Phycisphaerae bacterium]|nr:tRNA (cytidine(34)-2'-O)-methyltransferase [Phycisphaerae bacterium]MDW8262248.1 tRNA (cytidine(34)-2'-O)-methyltransferase [Phycisphaerales bacterium]
METGCRSVPGLLGAHSCELALVHPQIAPNTGNIARLCVATGTTLHLVRPMGFTLEDRKLRRSAMDYWSRLRLRLHDDLEAFRAAMATRRLWLFEPDGEIPLWQAPFQDGDVLVFGSETTGLPKPWLQASRDRTVCIPQSAGERCLNVATSAGIALYECLRRLHNPG